MNSLSINTEAMNEMIDAVIEAAFENCPDFAVVADRSAIQLALLVHGVGVMEDQQPIAA